MGQNYMVECAITYKCLETVYAESLEEAQAILDAKAIEVVRHGDLKAFNGWVEEMKESGYGRQLLMHFVDDAREEWEIEVTGEDMKVRRYTTGD